MKIAYSSHLKIFFIIFACLLFAHFPSFTGDFLKQDDWNATFWNLSIISSHPEFYNATIELFRPVSIIIILISDYISYNFENAKFIRFLTVTLMSLSAFITYAWQLKLKPDNIFFALAFSIIIFCLPASQLHSSTTTYIHMVIAIICGQLGMIYFHKAKLEEILKKNQKKFLLYSSVFIMLSLLNYPPATMFYFLFLLIFFLLNINESKMKHKDIYLFMLKATLFIFFLMLIYFFLAKFIHYILDIKPKLHGGEIRTVHIDWGIYNKLSHIYTMIKASLSSINLASYHLVTLKDVPMNLFLFFFTVLSLFYGLFVVYIKNLGKEKNIIKISAYVLLSFIIILLLLILSYFPLLPLDVKHPIWTTFRYTIVTAPFFIYLLIWSIINFKLPFINSFFNVSKKFLISFLLFYAVYKSNYVIGNFIVSPHVTELSYIEENINKKFLNGYNDSSNKKIIVIRSSKPVYELYNDYDMRINYSNNWLISATIYVLRKYNIDIVQTHKVMKWEEENIHIKSKWGEIISVNSINEIDFKYSQDDIIINMNNINNAILLENLK